MCNAIVPAMNDKIIYIESFEKKPIKLISAICKMHKKNVVLLMLFSNTVIPLNYALSISYRNNLVKLTLMEYNPCMKLADKITLTRVVLAPVFFLLFYIPYQTQSFLFPSACILIPLFVVMELTDFFDGFFARKQKQVSDFGKLFDPFADVLAHITVFLCFLVSGYMPAVAFLIIFMREYSQLFLRLIVFKNGFVMGARKGGKLKTVIYVVSAGYSLLLECLLRFGFKPFSDAVFFAKFKNAGVILYILCVVAALVSFCDYLLQYKKIKKNAEKD